MQLVHMWNEQPIMGRTRPHRGALPLEEGKTPLLLLSRWAPSS